MAILELDELPAGSTPPPLTEREIGELGRKLRRRLVDQWPRWSATVDAYRQAMRQAGHSARGQDVFGTLLAAADLLLYDQMPDAGGLTAWAAKLSAGTLAELEGDVTDEMACLNHLLSTVWEAPHDRRRMTLGRWISIAAEHISGECLPEVAQRLLMEAGIKVVSSGGTKWLAVANMHRGLSRIFDGTQWAGRPGAMGGWVQALRRLPHEVPKKALWFGVTAKGTLLPVRLCLPGGESRPPDGPADGGEAGDPLANATAPAPASSSSDASASSDRLDV